MDDHEMKELKRWHGMWVTTTFIPSIMAWSVFLRRSHIRATSLLLAHNALEPLLLHLRLRRRNNLCRVGVAESTSRLSILLAGCLGTANTNASGGDLAAARRAAVGVRDASTGDKLGTVSGTDVLRACRVGGYLRHGNGGNWECVSRRRIRANGREAYGRGWRRW
jgi:hypothetical protein